MSLPLFRALSQGGLLKRTPIRSTILAATVVAPAYIDHKLAAIIEHITYNNPVTTATNQPSVDNAVKIGYLLAGTIVILTAATL